MADEVRSVLTAARVPDGAAPVEGNETGDRYP